MRLLVVVLVAVGAVAQPRPVSDEERAAVSVVAAYLAGGAEAVYARRSADSPLTVQDIATHMGSREGVTWTLRTSERDPLFRVTSASGADEAVWLSMRGERVFDIRAGSKPARRTGFSPSTGGLKPALRWPIIAAVLAVLGAAIAAKWRLLGVAVLGLAAAAGIIAYRNRTPTPQPATVPRAAPVVERLPALDERDAELYYRRAAEKSSFDDLRTAWTLEPKPREELIRANLLADLRAKSLVSFFSATEPVRRSANLGTRALAWPAGAKAYATGELLRVELGNAAIEIPNGAALAPKDAQVIPATVRAQQLLARGGNDVRTATALARQNRWADLVKLTDKLEDDVPPEMLVLRLYALLHTDRVEEAKALADTGAVRAFAGKARSAIDTRMRRLERRRKLVANSQTIATPHFDIRHDANINPAIASRIGDLLEAELARIRNKLPPFEPQRVAVNVLGWDEFRAETQSDHILGVYDGEILFPFAAVEQFKPAVVAVITHELTHALVAQVTAGRAPRWFHEGVAARMELLDRHANAFRDTPPGLVLPVPLLDATMEKSTDEEPYVIAQTFIFFLEDRYGAGAIAKLASSFARGEEKVFGKTLDELNVEFREWGFHHNGEFVSNEPWPYLDLYSPGIDPRIRAGFKFGKRDQ